jgi:hypothetical protein
MEVRTSSNSASVHVWIRVYSMVSFFVAFDDSSLRCLLMPVALATVRMNLLKGHYIITNGTK